MPAIRPTSSVSGKSLLRRLALLAMLLCCGARPLRADGTQPVLTMQMKEEAEFDSAGNCSSDFELNFSPDLYKHINLILERTSVTMRDGKPEVTATRAPVGSVLRFLGIDQGAGLISDVEGQYDDSIFAITARARQQGCAIYSAGRWTICPLNGAKLPTKLRRSRVRGTTLSFEFVVDTPGIQIRCEADYHFPEGSTGIKQDPQTLEISVVMPPSVMPSAQATARPRISLSGKTELVTPLYKLYALENLTEFWLSRAIIENTTASPLTDLRVRFRVDNFSDWSPWTEIDAVQPGQTRIVPYHPVVSHDIMRVRNASTSHVQMQVEYTDPTGATESVQKASRLKVLGSQEATYTSYQLEKNAAFIEIFRNAGPVVASFVDPHDPVVQDVVGMISRVSRGSGNGLDDASALRFLATLHHFFRHNISYETTPGGMEDGRLYQTLKPARDVLRTRSGTCINLAMMYASIGEAADLKPSVVIVPGHAFVKFQLPSGKPLFIESTTCGGGTAESSSTFVVSQASAAANYEKHQALGKLIEIDIAAMRSEGISPPELAPLGNAPLTEWGIVAPPAPPAEAVVSADLLISLSRSLRNAGLSHWYDPTFEKGMAVVKVNEGDRTSWNFEIHADELGQTYQIYSPLNAQVKSANQLAFQSRIRNILGRPDGLAWFFGAESNAYWRIDVSVQDDSAPEEVLRTLQQLAPEITAVRKKAQQLAGGVVSEMPSPSYAQVSPPVQAFSQEGSFRSRRRR